MIYAHASAIAQTKNSSLAPSGFSAIEAQVAPAQKAAVQSLAAIWASRYVRVVNSYNSSDRKRVQNLDQLLSLKGREETAHQALKYLNLASAAAWSLTVDLLAEEIPRHGIIFDLIDPWQIAKDTHELFQLMWQAYARGEAPYRLSVLVGSKFGKIRQKYTMTDPRIVGFVSMHFHYTGQKLLDTLSIAEQSLVRLYLKVMNDHLYMPLRDTCEAAANHDLNSPALLAVQRLLPVSTEIAHAVCHYISRVHTGYQTYTGYLTAPAVRTSSIRDVEMFQVYLCLCVLENSLRSVRQELFPLCVMLYPQLNVRWQLVQDMLKVLGWELCERLGTKEMRMLSPYLHTITEMFSPAVFQNAKDYG
jgi:hypothetical protein